ncbi:glutathione S-transferase 1-like [Oratosquilla oratoria]|uniref:glutathione S-transferase 1-like n=1 Tax=Oratosquilla oratoria TaxID=337810 RepID=UPI003F76694D
MSIDLYHMPMSPPCRAVLLMAKVVGADINPKIVNIFEGEQMDPDFVAINPQHCIPTIVDGDLTLWESRAICCYLAAKYGEDQNLLPQEPEARARLDFLLYFDMSTVHHRMTEYLYPIMLRDQKPEPEKLEKLQEALGWLEGFLSGHDYAVGDSLTVADCVLAASVETIDAAGIDLSAYEAIQSWLERCRENIPDYEEANAAAAREFGEMVKGKMTE